MHQYVNYSLESIQNSEQESSLEKWTYVESPSPLIFYADKPTQKLVVPKIRHRFFPVHLRANTFHRINMR